MAVTSVFQADFTLFQAQVAIAQTKLEGFQKDTDAVAASLTKMEQSISGTAIVQAATVAAQAVENLGGVSKLTYKELQQLGTTAQEAVEKLNALGEKVPVGIQNLADAAANAKTQMKELANAADSNAQATTGWSNAMSVLGGTFGALSLQRVIDMAIDFGKEAVNLADHLQKLHDQTGISVESLQRYRSAGEAVGVSLDTIARSMETLQRKIGEGTPATVHALQDLGIQLKEVQDIPIEEAWKKVTGALHDMDDADRAAADGHKLLGNTYIATLPLIKEGTEKVSEQTAVMSSETTKALSDAKTSWNNVMNWFEVNVGEAMVDVLTMTTAEYRRWASSLKDATGELLKSVPGLKDMQHIYGEIVPPGLPKDLDDINAKFKQQEEQIKANKKAGDEFVQAQKNLASVGQTWQQTLADINPWILKDIEASLKAGASMKDLETFYGLTEAQGRAVNAMLKDQAELLKHVADVEKDTRQKQSEGILGLSKLDQEQSQARFKAEAAGITAIQKVSAELKDSQMKDSMDTTSYQVMKIWEKADAEVKAFKGTADQSKQYADLVYQQAQQLQDAIYAHLKDSTQQILFDVVAMANKIKGVADDATAHIQQAHQQLETLVGGVKMAGTAIETAYGNKYLVGPNGQRIQLGPHGELPDNFDQMMGGASFSTGISNQARIGTGFSDTGMSGGITIVNQITQPLGTPQAIAGAVGDALMNQLRGQGVRTP